MNIHEYDHRMDFSSNEYSYDFIRLTFFVMNIVAELGYCLLFSWFIG